MNQDLYDQLSLQYGKPLSKNAYRIPPVNQLFFATLLLETHQLRFDENRWFAFNGKYWKVTPASKIARWVLKLLQDYARATERLKLMGKISKSLLVGIEGLAQVVGSELNFPLMDCSLVPCRNVVLRWDEVAMKFIPEEFSPDQYVRSLLSVDYNPEADYQEFKRVVLDEVLSTEDQLMVQRYLGIALMPINLTQNFLLLQGVAGSSKSLLVRLLVEILGDERVFDLDIKDAGQDYALSGLSSQTLLVASESAGDALCTSGAPFVKKAVGGDKIQARLKFINEKRQLCGHYSLIVVSNEHARFHYTGDGKEWTRRLLPVLFDKQHEKTEKNLVNRLLEQHGSGILNWLLEGAADVLRNEWNIPLTTTQELRCERLICRSEPVRAFVARCVELSAGDDFSSDEAFQCYCEIGAKGMLPMLTREAFFKQLAVKMAERFFGTTSSNNLQRSEGGRLARTCRGYQGFKLRSSNVYE